MEAEIIPMCEDQGMAIVPWAALGGGQLMSVEQRKQKESDPDARPARFGSEHDMKVCEALERIAGERNSTLQAVVSSSVLRLNALTLSGFGIPISTITIRFPYRWSTDRRAYQSYVRCTRH